MGNKLLGACKGCTAEEERPKSSNIAGGKDEMPLAIMADPSRHHSSGKLDNDTGASA